MIIKKFQAGTEAEAIIKAKDEMGSGAVVLNIKTIKHRGISRLFKKDYVEVTAAIEEMQHVTAPIPQLPKINIAVDNAYKSSGSYTMEPSSNVIEEKLNSLQTMLENRMKASELEK